jgi:hypothetical protein
MTYHTIMIGDPVWAPLNRGVSGTWRAATVESIGHARYEKTSIKIRFLPSPCNPHGQLGYRRVSELVKRKPELSGQDKPASEKRQQVCNCDPANHTCGLGLLQELLPRFSSKKENA